MSYEPTIIINKRSLESKRKFIQTDHNWKKHSAGTKVAIEALIKALELKPIHFPKMDIVIIKPELSGHNKKVRDLLVEYGVEFQITTDI